MLAAVPCKTKMLTFQVSSYCLLVLQSIAALRHLSFMLLSLRFPQSLNGACHSISSTLWWGEVLWQVITFKVQHANNPFLPTEKCILIHSIFSTVSYYHTGKIAISTSFNITAKNQHKLIGLTFAIKKCMKIYVVTHASRRTWDILSMLVQFWTIVCVADRMVDEW